MDLQNNVGKQIAPAGLTREAEAERLVTLAGLLSSVDRRSRMGGKLHTAAASFARFLGFPTAKIEIQYLETHLESFRSFLRDRRHTSDTVRGYCYCLNQLLKRARSAGWAPPPTAIDPSWECVLAAKPPKAIKSIIFFACRSRLKPNNLAEEHLHLWVQEQLAAGKRLSTCKATLSEFRQLLGDPKHAELTPLVVPALKRYGVPIRHMHPVLRAELSSLQAYLTDELEFDRVGIRQRPDTIRTLTGLFERLTGYLENVRDLPRITNFRELLTKINVGDYMKWAIQDRKMLGETLFRHFSALRAALIRHPKYVELDLSWLPVFLEKLPRSTRAEIDRRKRYISYKSADLIHRKIRELREHSKDVSPVQRAISLRNELLMLWLIVAPFRQRNLRECRIEGGSHLNLFCAPIADNSTASRSEWITESGKSEPGKRFWQVFFSSDETKGKQDVHGFVPKEIAQLLEEYLLSRSLLLTDQRSDPGTLFLSDVGKPLDSEGIRTLVEELSARHAGRAVNPHLFRDIVAYEWLSQHPEDYLTVSKLLWHKNLEFTLKVYGSRFNESTGLARMDDWRNKHSKTDFRAASSNKTPRSDR